MEPEEHQQYLLANHLHMTDDQRTTMKSITTDTLDRDQEVPTQAGYSRLRDLIRLDIVQGRLRPGARLKIAELAQRYDTSAIPVREALQQLQGEGVVRFIANRGASVRPLDENFIRDIHEIRALIEPFLVTWFVRHHSENSLTDLVETQTLYDKAVAAGDLARARVLNQQFHGICYNGHYNEEALELSNRHNDIIYAISDRFPQSRSRVAQVSYEHWAIIDAIRKQDAMAASSIVADHVRHAGQHLIESMQAEARMPLSVA